MSRKSIYFLFSLVLANSLTFAKEVDFSKVYRERLSSVVAIEFTAKSEVKRETLTVYGTVMDEKGLIVSIAMVADFVPDEWIQDIKIYPLGVESDGFDATYLGRDSITQVHFFRAEKAMWNQLKSVQSFGVADSKIGENLWGFGVARITKSYYMPYLLQSDLGAIEAMPWDYGIANNALSAIGGPVFNNQGAFIGIGVTAMTVMYNLGLENESFRASLKRVSAGEIFWRAKDFLEVIPKDPKEYLKKKDPWLGLVGMQALPNEVLNILNLKGQGAIAISNIFQGSPADKAGLKQGDIILALDNQPIKKFPDNQNSVDYFIAKLSKNKPGDTIVLNIIRNKESLKLSIPLTEAPKKEREAKREFFPRLGLSVREFVVSDAVKNYEYTNNLKGVIARYVQENSPVDDAGLKQDDWILEINGQPIGNYQEAIDILNKIENNKDVTGLIILVERKGETKLLRVKLH